MISLPMLETADRMYDLTIAGLFIAATNIGLAYGATEVWKLTYPSYIMLKLVVGAVSAVIIRILAFAWKDRLVQSFKDEYRQGELLEDVIMFLILMLVAAVITFYLVYRRYGAVGIVGVVAANVAVNWAV